MKKLLWILVLWILVALSPALLGEDMREYARGPFRIDILDDNGDTVEEAGGPILTAMTLNNTIRLSRMGQMRFTMPAADPKAAYITVGTKFDVYDKGEYIGRFLYSKKTITEQSGAGTLDVECWDQLDELNRVKVGLNRQFKNVNVTSAIPTLLTLAGWTGTIEGVGNITAQFQNTSVLRAIDEIRDRQGVNYRLESTSVLGYGSFGDDSGIRLIKDKGQQQIWLEEHPEVALIQSISYTEETDNIIDEVTGLGAGTGINQLTLEGATGGTYTVQSRMNPDGVTYEYYIEDTSVEVNRAKQVVFPQITPISNSSIDTTQAKTSLLDAVEHYLKKRTTARETYQMTVTALQQTIMPGDTVHLTYVGEDEGAGTYLNVDNDFYITDITYNRSANGDRNTTLVLSVDAQRRTTDEDVLTDVVASVETLKVDVTPNISSRTACWIQGNIDDVYSVTGKFKLRGWETRVHKVMLLFEVWTYISAVEGIDAHPAANTDNGGAYTGDTGNNTVPGDPHQHPQTNPDHVHRYGPISHSGLIDYGIYKVGSYPNIGLTINGTDRTIELGGPWSFADGLIDKDITDYVTPNSVNYVNFYNWDGSGYARVIGNVDIYFTMQPIPPD